MGSGGGYDDALVLTEPWLTGVCWRVPPIDNNEDKAGGGRTGGHCRGGTVDDDATGGEDDIVWRGWGPDKRVKQHPVHGGTNLRQPRLLRLLSMPLRP